MTKKKEKSPFRALMRHPDGLKNPKVPDVKIGRLPPQ